MRILSITLLWHLFKWFAILIILYAVVYKGISPQIICFLLLIRLGIQLLLKFISGIIKIAIVFVILWLLTLIF